MKVVILAGGLGTRIGEETYIRPKPMIEIGGHPILWHIMKIYSAYGFHDFVICLGYKGYMIKEYFADYYLHTSDVRFDFTDNNRMDVLNNVSEPWQVTLINTGLDTQTGARIKRIRRYIGNEPFMLTYGDGVCDVNINELLSFHRSNPAAYATLTAIKLKGRFGMLDIEQKSNVVRQFVEKGEGDGGWINGGFMVLEPEVFDYIDDNSQRRFEMEPLMHLAGEGRLQAYRHEGFWHCMDTQRDKASLEELWNRPSPPWKVW